MSTNQKQHVEEEVDLRILIMLIWKKKVLIIGITLITAIISIIFTLFVLKPVYNAQMNIVLNMPDAFHTKYGDYTLPITTNQQYMNLFFSNDVLLDTINDMDYSKKGITLENLRDRISINIDNKDLTQNIYNVSVSAGDPEEAKQLASTLFYNFTKFLDIITTNGAIDYYENSFSVSLSSSEVSLKITQELLHKNEALLEEMPQTINQKQAMDEVDANVNDFVVLENIVNPNYLLIEADIIENKQSINSIKDSMKNYQKNLEELNYIKNDLKLYYENGECEKLNTGIANITDTSVYLSSQPTAPSQKTSPRNTFNVIIGTMAGGMIALSVVLFNWWLKEGYGFEKNEKRAA